MRGRFQGAAVVLGVHHGHIGAAVVQHLLHAVHTAALAACADRGAGDGVIASQAVHLTTGCLTVLQRMNTEFKKKEYTLMCDIMSVYVFLMCHPCPCWKTHQHN